MARNPELNTQARRRACAAVERTQTNCHLCGLPIPMGANRQTDPYGFSVDEVIPRSKGGSATDMGNLRAAHRICNSRRSNRPITPTLLVELRAAITQRAETTSRTW